MDATVPGRGAVSKGRRFPTAVVIVVVLAVLALVATVAWLACPRPFPAEAITLRPGDAYTALSGVAITVPGQEDAQAYRERRPEASEKHGIADSLQLAEALPDFPVVTLYSFWDASRHPALRGVTKTYALAGRGDGGAAEVRWRDFGADRSALAIVTRIPGHDTGMVLALDVAGVTDAATAREAARRLWNDLSAQGVALP